MKAAQVWASLALLTVGVCGARVRGLDTQRAIPNASTVVLGASGDLLIHQRVIESAAAHGWAHVVGALDGLTQSEDLSFANLETPLSTRRPTRSGSPPILGAPSELAAALHDHGVDVLSLANNHAWDQYAPGARDTRLAVTAAGIQAVGAGPSDTEAFAASIATVRGLRVATVAITERVNSGPGEFPPTEVIARWTDDAVVAAALTRARSQADVVVVSIHWSHDFVEAPSLAQRRRAAWLVEHGADIILGHGPHVLHEVARLASPRGEALCAYSLGNLVSNQGFRYRVGRAAYPGAHPATWLPTTRDGAWLRVRVSREAGALSVRASAVPLFTANDSATMRTAPHIAIAPLALFPDPRLQAERTAAIAAAIGDAAPLGALAE